MPLLTPKSWFGLGVETTRGTGVTPVAYLPIETPQWTPKPTYLEDKGLRGSASETYGNQIGVRHDEFDMKGNAYLDTFPHLLRALLGSADTVVAAPTNTTLAVLAAAGAVTISTTASIPAGSAITIGVYPTIDSHVTSAVSGAGPYTVTLTTPLVYGQSNGATVTGQTAHTIGLVNAVAGGAQPPSYTLVDFDAGAAGTTTARQLAGGMLSDLAITFASNATLGYTAKWWANPEADIAAPTQSFSNAIMVPAWACAVSVAGTTYTTVIDGSLDLKRSTEAIHTLGTQGPYRLWDAPLQATGKLVLVCEQGDLTLTRGTTRAPLIVDFQFVEPTTGQLIDLHMNQVQFKDPKINRGKRYLEVETMFQAEANTVDAVAGGFSPLKTICGNGQVAAY